MKDYDSMKKFPRLIIEAKLSSGVWKAYRQDFILRDGNPIIKDTLDFLKEQKRR
jgi:hypothetical protein